MVKRKNKTNDEDPENKKVKLNVSDDEKVLTKTERKRLQKLENKKTHNNKNATAKVIPLMQITKISKKELKRIERNKKNREVKKSNEDFFKDLKSMSEAISKYNEYQKNVKNDETIRTSLIEIKKEISKKKRNKIRRQNKKLEDLKDEQNVPIDENDVGTYQTNDELKQFFLSLGNVNEEADNESSSDEETSENKEEINEKTNEINKDNNEMANKTNAQSMEIEDNKFDNTLLEVVKQTETEPKIVSKPATFVTVDRKPDIQEHRNTLPVIGEEYAIMEAISENDIVLISGATGSGKTTQIPQFLYEAGYALNRMKIGVTEPRKVAAINTAKRVKEELDIQLVGYQVRHDNKSHDLTQIKFMTDGILLQELKSDSYLWDYSAIIIDEAHERSVHTDLLIGLLSKLVLLRRKSHDRAVQLRSEGKEINEKYRPLKLIIMSATLQLNQLIENRLLFPTAPPVINIPGQMYPVEEYFTKVTKKNYLEESFKSVVEIHQTLSEGTILVFVAGQDDCETMCRWLRTAFPLTDKFKNLLKEEKTEKFTSKNNNTTKSETIEQVDISKLDLLPKSNLNINYKDEEVKIEDDKDLESYDMEFEDEAIENFEDIVNRTYKNDECVNPINALPMYSKLEENKQQLVFGRPPSGYRNVIVSTNICETSLTIPGVKYVVDCGVEKIKEYNYQTGLYQFRVKFISKSSAAQRKGRAGRLGPGKCFRIYSMALYSKMEEFPKPEILNKPIDDVMMQIFNVGQIYSKNGNVLPDLPTMPDSNSIEEAKLSLINLGAIRKRNDNPNMYEFTALGEVMSQLPLSPKFSRLIVSNTSLMDYTVALAAVLSVPNFFLTINDMDNIENIESKKKIQENKQILVKTAELLAFGDVTRYLANITTLRNHEKKGTKDGELRKIAENTMGIRWKAYLEYRMLRKQLCEKVNNLLTLEHPLDYNKSLVQPKPVTLVKLRKYLMISAQTNIATINRNRKPYDKKTKGSYILSTSVNLGYIGRDSVLYDKNSEWVCYQELIQVDASRNAVDTDDNSKRVMRTVITIDPKWLPIYCPNQCVSSGLLLFEDNSTDQDLLPQYSTKHDCILVKAKRIHYGKNSLILPSDANDMRVTKSIADETLETQERNQLVKWFARFLLEGKVIESFSNFSESFKVHLNTKSITLRIILSGNEEINNLCNALLKLPDYTLEDLEAQWRKDKYFLLKEIRAWFKPDLFKSVVKKWPPVQL